jgi:hypothetical protein
MEWDDDASSNTGFNLRHLPDHSLTVDQCGYLDRMLTDLGATNLPSVDRPSLPDFFDPPSDTTPVPQPAYRKIVGCLIYLLPTWHKIRKEIVHLSTRQGKAVQSDMDKAIRLLAYINSHRSTYVRYSGTDTQLYFWADASPNAHPTGHSHAGYYITVGATSGAVASHSAAQTDCIAQGAMEAEYVVLARALKQAIHIRRLLHSMGIAQTEPITCYDDNMSAINLTLAPAVTKQSKHIHVRYHLIRDAAQQGIVNMVKVPGTDNPADLFTKTLSTPLATHYGDRIQNVVSPAPPSVSRKSTGTRIPSVLSTTVSPLSPPVSSGDGGSVRRQ